MMRIKATSAAAMAVVALAVAVLTGNSFAADPPKWVAALYIEAQKAVGLRWGAVAGSTATKVLRSETKGAGHKEIAAPTAPQYFDTAVEPGSTYYYVLQSVGADGVSANSDEKAVTIPGQKKVELAPPAWKSIAVTSTTEFGKVGFKVALQWLRNNAVVAYNVYRSEVSGKDYQLLTSVSEDQYVDAAVQEGKTYYYVITGLDNAFQESKYSEEKSAFLEAKKKEEKRETLPNPKLAVRGSKEGLKIYGGEGWEFRGASDLALDSDGNIYAPDSSKGRVFVLDTAGAKVRQFGEQGAAPGKMLYPTGIGLDADDNVYVTDRAEPARIVVYSPQGQFKKQIVVQMPDAEYMKQFTRPTKVSLSDVAVGKDGRIYVTDSNTARVVMLDPEGNFIKNVGGPGTEAGKMTFPGWLAMNPAGTELHICNGLNRRIEVYNPEGEYVRTYGLSKSFVGSFIGPTGITFDDKGNSFVCDAAMSTLQAFSPEGQYLFHVGREKSELDPENKQRPLPFSANLSGVLFHPKAKMLYFSGKDLTGPYLGARVLLEQ